ncbi:secreted RxLR effector peptide protein, putative [Phytophthora infestans T30-4]|uniref:RxLR effector protein n=3 Tax=Phytophthora infestans TaxID=4787 RepID=D0NM34_PHYIT|nr:secreted RxLR effector peptide protein, putative [Phytophthora infestans T30-4]EEY60755.1 secreted RxLR effector peptide protein, putative [Phytophthora infestans T30-4]KAF4045299.1 RXLR domain-containing protein [Phytophthora infestans]|eukprot:XP_002899701.1 secreted RxLR effector peptide protein, putative [Phytophthora infestans T30-4]
MTLVVLATVLLLSGTAVSNADRASVLNVDAVHSSNILTAEEKRFLRSHQTTDDEGENNEHVGEERAGGANLLAGLKLQKMGRDTSYRDKVFQRWKNYGKSVEDVSDHVPSSLTQAFEIYLRMRKNTGKVYTRPHRQIKPR